MVDVHYFHLLTKQQIKILNSKEPAEMSEDELLEAIDGLSKIEQSIKNGRIRRSWKNARIDAEQELAKRQENE